VAVVVGFGIFGAVVTSWLVRRSARLTVIVRDESGDRRSAGIFVDGSRRCDFSPCVVEEPAGDHIVTVAVEGTAPMMQSATFRAGDDATMTFILPPPVPAAAASAAPPPKTADSVAVPPSASSIVAAQAPSAPSAVPSAIAAALPAAPVRPPVQASLALARDAVRKPASEGAPCKLQFNSIPVADITLDGNPLGETPRTNVTASAGDHRAVFAAGDARKTVAFHCGNGEEKTVAVRVP
jgi:hypothetical protein